ncbi:sodium/calcium exchanger 1 [Fuerstiella marisgermanici]|uniref:Sodium/calcium exchanger 1 n=2 Tax=Fuerstiella marisgermanici TaxID=1891926 RepID=A0A1P8W8R6_9PLAN|nr:sodium/calcium exchanger 1 [Fuerstiella marisgermanici]
MARSNQGPKLTDFLARMFGKSSRTPDRPSRRRREMRRQKTTEQLESRALLTLVGIDFGGGTTPTNWTAFSGTSDVSLNDLVDESGTATAIDVAIDIDTSAGIYDSFAPPATELPSHTQSLAGIDRAYTDQGNIELTFSDLGAGQLYEVYVFAGDRLASDQRVVISEPTSGTTLTQFTQPHDANQLVVNGEVGASNRALSSYAVFARADSNGEMKVRVDSSANPTGFFGLAGVALQANSSVVPDVSIGDVVVNESDGTAAFPVSLSAPAVSDTTLTLTTTDGSAVAGQDYVTTTAQVTIPRGATTATATFDVAIVDDADVEADETFVVSVASVDSGVVGGITDTGTGTIAANDAALTVSIAASEVAEGAGAAAATATVTRNSDTSAPLTVFLTSSDTSEASVPVSVVIAAGQATSPAFDITAIDDGLVDGTQTVNITATSTSHAAGSASLDVTDDDTPALTLSIFASAVSESAGPAATTATVTRNTDTTEALVVDLSSSDVTAATVTNSVTIAAGATSATFDISAVDDTLIDGTQTVTISASATVVYQGANTTIQASSDIGILDDDLGGWNAEGPFSATNGQTENVAPNGEIVGAIHTVIAHPTDPDVVYVGAVNGGVWRTNNATAVNPSWTPLTDDMPSQSISALVWDTADTTNQTIYAGTGRQSSYAQTGNERVGLLKSTDGGNSWQVLDGNGELAGANISGIAANGNTVVVSVNVADSYTYSNVGIFRSTDGGATFEQVSIDDGSATGLPGGVSYDLVVDPTNPDIMYTNQVFSIVANGLYKSIDGGASWNKVSSAAVDAFITDFNSNLEMAVGHHNNVYAGIVEFGAPVAFFRSGDGGATWVQLDDPVTFENTGDVGLNPRGSKGPTAGDNPTPAEIAGGQGSIHFSIVADPTDPNIVYVGGDRQPRQNEDTGSFPNSIGAQDFTGRLFRGDASLAAGSQWVHLTHRDDMGAAGGGTASSSAPHADSREMTFDANGDLLEVDDGGIYRRTDPRSNQGDWFAMTGDLQVTEVHDVAYDSVSNTLMTGNQDTGTTYQPGQGSTQWVSLSTADGGDVVIDDRSLAAGGQSIRYSSFQNLSAFRRTVWDAAGNLVSTSFPALTGFTGGVFRTPVELNSIDPSRLVIQGAGETFETLDQGSTATSLNAGGIGNQIYQNALAYGGRKNGTDNADVLWVGSGDDVLVRTAGGAALAPTASDPTSDLIVDLTIDPDDWASAAIVTRNEVQVTTDTGASWFDVTGDLFTSFPNSAIYSVSYIANAVSDALIVGTNMGVFGSFVSTIGTWFEVGGGMPNVIAFDMEYDATDDVLAVGTLGRGAWSLQNARSALPTTPDVSIGDVTVNENDGVASFMVTLATPAVVPTTLTLTTVDGTALAGQDYTATTATVEIPAGATTATTTFDVPLINDTNPELPASFSVVVQTVETGSVGDTSVVAAGIINDDDATITVSIADASITEPGGANPSTTAIVTRNTDISGPLDVMLMSDDTSEATVVGMVTIPAGQPSAVFDITAVADLFVDGTQTVTITPTAAGHVSVADTVDVTDEDVPTLTITILADSINEADGPAATRAMVTRNTDVAADLTVNLVSSDTTEATVASSITIFAGNQTSASFPINAIDDAVIDGAQVVTITASLTGFISGSDSVTVLDDETKLVRLAIDPLTLSEEGGTAAVRAVLNEASTADVTVTMMLSGSATITGPGTDFSMSTLTLTVPAGQLQSPPATITGLSDALDEPDETVVISIDPNSVVNATIDPVFLNATATILDDDAPPLVTLTPSDTAVIEGEDVVYTLELSAASSFDVTVNLALGGTATATGASRDFLDPAPGLQIVIPAGQTQATVSIETVDDALSEGVETIILGITGVVNGTAGNPSQRTVQINDNDPLPTVTFTVDNASIIENLGQATFTARLSEPSGQTVTIDLAKLGLATENVDYTISHSQLVIPAGQMVATTKVTATSDAIDEHDENVLLRFANVTNATVVGTVEAQTTILDDDIAPTVSLSSSVASIPEDGGTFTFFATLNAVSGKDVTVNLMLRGTATDGVDYTRTPTSPTSNLTVVIPAGSTSVPIDVSVTDDTLDEFDELVVIEFVSVVNAVENIVQQASTTIVDNDAPATVTLQVAPAAISEAGTLTSTVTASLSAPSGKEVRVTLGMSGNAVRNTDYTIDSTTIVIPAGSTTGTATITPIDDLLDEFDETVVVDITAVVNGTEDGQQQVEVAILDNEAVPRIDLAASDAFIPETGGTATFTATLSEISGRDVTVTLSPTGNATLGVDYSDPGTQIVIQAGQLAGSVTMNALPDALNEFDETVTLTIDSADFASIGTASQLVTIVDDDPIPSLTIAADAASYSESAASANFTLTLSEVSGRDVTVAFNTGGDASAGGDYVDPGTQIVIPAGQQSVPLPITLLSDDRDENDEQLTVNLTFADYASPGTTVSATTLLIDDDATPTVTLSFDPATIAEAGETSTRLIATLSAPSNLPITLDVSLAGTALGSGVDYNAGPQSLVIAPGEETAEIIISAVDDSLFEQPRDVIVASVGSASNTIWDGNSVTAEIIDNDLRTLTLTIAPGTVNEIDGAAAATATLTRNTRTDSQLTVTLFSDDVGEASVQSTIIIPVGASAVTFPVNSVNDGVLDGTQTVTVTASSPGYVSGVDTVDVEDATVGVGLEVSEISVSESGSPQITVTARTQNPAVGDQTVDINVNGLNITAGDYTLSNTRITIPSGQTTGTATLQILDDQLVESTSEILNVTMSNLSSGLALTGANSAAVEIIDNDTALVSVNDVTSVEANTGLRTYTFTVSTTNASDRPYSVGFNTVDGTATVADGDYTSANGTINFNGQANETHTVVVQVNGDRKVELDETFTLQLSNIQSGTNSVAFDVGGDQGTGTIANNDSGTISIGDVTLQEGNTGDTSFVFTVSLDAEIGNSISLIHDTADGTATSAGGDYTPIVVGSTTFNANTGGPQTASIEVLVSGDSMVELNEAFLLNLSNLVTGGLNVTLANTSATGTITNDDASNISVDSPTVVEADAGTSQMVFTITLNGAVDVPVTVDYITADGTALTSDGDYVGAAAAGLSFSGADGEIKTVAVTINGDTKVERNETFELVLRNLVAAGRNVTIAGPGVGTIQNDESATISIDDVVLDEGNAGVTTATFTVTLVGEVDSPVSIDYATAADTASDADNDYAAASGTLTFPPNLGSPLTQTFSVLITGDEKVEHDESFFINLTNLAAAGRDVSVIDNQATVTINDDDSATIAIDNVAVSEGVTGDSVVTFTVSLDAEVADDVTLDYATADDRATTADGDYTSSSGGLTFAANSGGPQTQTFEVTVHGDQKVELNETFFANLSNLNNSGVNVSVADAQGVGTITNDDVATITIDDVTQNEGDAGTSIFTFTISLEGEVDANVGLVARTSAGTASPTDGDYAAGSATNLLFNAGNGRSQTQTVSVTVNGDEKVELDETFFVDLSGLSASGRAVSVTDSRGVGRIVNDDAATLTINDVTLQEGSSGNTAFEFTVTMSGEVDVPVQYGYVTADDTATAADGDFAEITAGSDAFVANNGVGPQTRTITVQVAGDGRVESDEAFLAILNSVNAAGRNVTIADAQGMGNIIDDDTATISIDDVTIAEGDAGTTDFVFTVTLSNEVSSPVSINYDTVEGTATVSGNDFVANTGNVLTFAANAGDGPQTLTFAVTVNGDATVERDETFQVDLSGLVTNGQAITLADSQGLGAITNDETAGIIIDDVSRSEGNSGTTNYVFTVTLEANVDTAFNLDFTTADSTADASDFSSTSGTLSFAGAAGETQSLSVSVVGDNTVELDEAFFVNLTNLAANGRNIALTKAQGVGTIVNDDAATISIVDSTTMEGNSGTPVTTLLVRLNGTIDTPVTLDFQTQDGTATVVGNDYTEASGTITLPAGTNPETTIQVNVRGDVLIEQNEAFFVDLTNLDAGGRNVTLTDSRGQVTVNNDDFVNVTITDAQVVEQQSPNRSFLSFTVRRDNASIPIDIDFVTVDGTATVADGDYLARNGTLSFPANSPLTANVVVEVIGDHRLEPDEILYVDISSSMFGVQIANPRAVGTIVQDDGFISGQKWHDIDADGVRDANEPGLDGWVIQVLNDQGDVVTSATTGSIDLNNDGSIDPITEQGLYNIPTGAGTWTISEVMQQGWRQTSPNSGNAQAYELDQERGLRFTGSYFENWGGLGEKWLFGDDGWTFITPNGDVFEWNGSPRENLSGDLIVGLGEIFHSNPALLFNAQPPGNRTVTVETNQTTSGINFGNAPTGVIEGQKFHDVDANGQRDSSEPYLNGWTITLRDESGNIVATTTTADIDRNGNGSIDPTRERGVYRFENLLPGNYTVSEERRAGWIQSGDGGIFAGAAYDLNQQRNFREAKFDFLNWGGRNEKWLWSDVGWHFVTPDGSIYEWDGSPRTNLTGTLVSRLNASYFQDLSLLYNAAQPADYTVSITGQEVTGLNFANTLAHNGTGQGNVQVTVNGSNAQISGDAQKNTIVVYTAADGSVMIAGAGSTSINGSAAPFLLSTNGTLASLNVSLSSGDDQLVLSGITAGSLDVQTGGGLDLVTIDNVVINGSATIGNSSGVDEHRIHGSDFGSLNVNTGGLVSLQNSEVDGELAVVGSSTPTTVFVQGSTVDGNVDIETGSGADAIIANRSSFGANVSVNSGGGNDLLTLRASQVAGNLVADGRGNNDQIGISNGSTVNGSATVRGGSGSDTFATDGTVAGSPTLTRIESTINSDLENLIDLALSNFDDLLLEL